MKLAYCDKIADTIQRALKVAVALDTDRIINDVGRIEWDLHPTQGYFVSPKKCVKVWDMNGKAYTVTIEEAPCLDREKDRDFGEKVVDTVAD
jgi:hypothetical protein